MLDTKEFVPAESRWQDIFLHLKKEGFDVYSPGSKVGECIKPYIVVKDNGSNRHNSFSTDNQLYSVMCYVPQNSYSKLEPYVNKVKESMVKLRPMILPNGNQTPSFLDDIVKAHMISVEYKNYKKIQGGI